MKVAHLSGEPEKSVTFRDGLGVRVAAVSDAGERLERFTLPEAFAPVSKAVQERVSRLQNLHHVRFARLRGFETTPQDGTPIVISSETPGRRLSDVLLLAGHGLVTVETGPALQVTREVLAALAVLHDSRNVTHGSIAPERIVLNPNGRVVMVEHVLSQALDKLHLPRQQLWRDWRIATPPAAGPVRFDTRTDLAQAGVTILALLLGRPIDEEEYPHRLRSLLPAVRERLSEGGASRIARDLQQWLERLLPIDGGRPFASLKDAQLAFEALVSSTAASLGMAPARVKALLSACAALEVIGGEPPVQPASHSEAAPLAGPVPHVDVAPDVARSAPHDADDLDIEALLRLAAELEDADGPVSVADAPGPGLAQPSLATLSAPPAPPAPAAAIEEALGLGALASERQSLHQQFADLLAQVAPETPSPASAVIAEPAPASLVQDAIRWTFESVGDTGSGLVPWRATSTHEQEASAEHHVQLEQTETTPDATSAEGVSDLDAWLTASLARGQVAVSEPAVYAPVDAALVAPIVVEVAGAVDAVADEIAPADIAEAHAVDDIAEVSLAEVATVSDVAPGIPEVAVDEAGPDASEVAPDVTAQAGTAEVTAVSDPLPAIAEVEAADANADAVADPAPVAPIVVEVAGAVDAIAEETCDAEIADAPAVGDIAEVTLAEDSAGRDVVSVIADVDVDEAGSDASEVAPDAIAEGDTGEVTAVPDPLPAIAEVDAADTSADAVADPALIAPIVVEAAAVVDAVANEIAPADIADAAAADDIAEVTLAEDSAGRDVVSVIADVDVDEVGSDASEVAPDAIAEGDTGEVTAVPEPLPAIAEVDAADASADAVADTALIAPIDVGVAAAVDAVADEIAPCDIADAAAADDIAEVTLAEDSAGPAVLSGPADGVADDAGHDASEVAPDVIAETPGVGDVVEIAEANRAAEAPAVDANTEAGTGEVTAAPDPLPAIAEVDAADASADAVTDETDAADFADAAAADDLAGVSVRIADGVVDEAGRDTSEVTPDVIAETPGVGGVVEIAEAAQFAEVGIAEDTAVAARSGSSKRRRSRRKVRTLAVPAPVAAPVTTSTLEPAPTSPPPSRGLSLMDRDVPAWRPPADLRDVVADAARRVAAAPTPVHVPPPAAATVPDALIDVAPAAALYGPPPAVTVVADLMGPEPESVREPEARLRTVVVLSRQVNWRRTAAAAVIIALLETAAFGAAWWWVQPGAKGTLVVETSVPGVEVLLDGEFVGHTPFHDDVRPGRHTLTLKRGGLERTMPVEINLGVVTTQTLPWPRPSHGSLRVTSAPEGAEVVVGGRVRGRTPLTIDDLAAGRQTLLLRGPSGTVSTAATVVAGETAVVDVPIFAGWVQVHAAAELVVSIGGARLGTSVDGPFLLSPGTHRVDVSSDALGFTETLTATVEPGRVRSLTVTLPEVPLLAPGADGAEVFVDGVSRGVLPDASITVPVGTHEVVLRSADGSERRRTLTVRAGAPVSID